MNQVAVQPQIEASDPSVSAFVTANAGTGKTWTLVARVARLLLRGADPATILCVTYTKAAAAEMQSRLFAQLGEWAVAPDPKLRKALRDLDERTGDLARARGLFARALETPGGLKIQTIHAFCETLLKRFPLEAGVSPGFQVLEEEEAQLVAARARDRLAMIALDGPDGPISRAYGHFSVELDFRRFNEMFQTLANRRAAIRAYADRHGDDAGWRADVWARCGFNDAVEPEVIETDALALIDWAAWRNAAQALIASPSKSDPARGAAMGSIDDTTDFAQVWDFFSTDKGAPLNAVCTAKVAAPARDWLKAEQTRLWEVCQRARAARVGRDTCHVITLGLAYAALYEAAKDEIGGLDFADLIDRVGRLLAERADAAWVLYKLDGGIEHVLLDEAQDTAPEQWDILHELTEEFFSGTGRARLQTAPRTMFAVGDEKQSIYSFQGAHPERFHAESEAYRRRVERVREPFVSVPLEDSRRSTPAVLAFVDAVFADPEAAAGLSPGRAHEPLHHRALRDDAFGAIDVWPLKESDETDEVDPWWSPVDARPGKTGNKKLAERIAKTIKQMIADRVAVFDKVAKTNRAVTAGDFLILVRRRANLFHEIIRALKAADVASGGADRLALSEHIAFKDLLALGRFARFPGDDLTLAALLRSPFCDVGEASLFDLAYGRGGASLWATLNRRVSECGDWRAARDFLGWARAEADARPPFDFYARVLTRLDGRGRSMRARLLTRLGREAEDAIEAFLGEALSLERRRVHDLERFVDEMAKTDIEVKREAEEAQGEVRVMTAHGAKGLEAPIVILPDTTTRATAQGGPLLDAVDGGFLWAPRKPEDCPASEAARAARETAVDHESLRLLYVALTRARDRLIIAGVKQRGLYERSWHDFISRALEREEIASRSRIISGAEGLTRFGDNPVGAASRGPTQAELPLTPTWAATPAPAEPLIVRYAQPSTLADSEAGPAPSPLAERFGLGRFRRGILVHRLLQLLPDLPAAERAGAAMQLLAREPDLTDGQRQEMAGAALAVLADEQFAAVFGPGSRAEVAVAGGASSLPAALKVSGRIDRLVVGPDRVLVVDFKSNRPAPARIEDADPAYLTQMALYVAVLEEVFPGRAVEAALVWTDGPKLMAVPENMVRETLARLKTEG